jgi:NADH dehydrogenase
MSHDVVIVGGGFGGLHTARALRRAPVRLTLVDRRNFHLFQPLLYQVATGGLSPGDIAAPLRSVLKGNENTRVLLGEVVDLDPEGRRVILEESELLYDTLVLAAGVRHHYFGNERWSDRAPGLKTVEDATGIRSRILRAFELAESTTDPDERRKILTFVVVGAGPTGVELAGAIGELACQTLKDEFRAFEPSSARIVLVEGDGRVLPGYPDTLSIAAAGSLKRLGVEVKSGSRVISIETDSVRIQCEGRTETLPVANVFWAAGIQASPLAQILADRVGAQLDPAGRVHVRPDCTVPGRPEILVIGDMNRFGHQTGESLPGVAPVAMQQGQYAARLIRDRCAGRRTPPFRYRNRGNLAVIGRAAAVADLGRFRFSGYFAWILWLFVHIMYLVGFENRLVVFVRWASSYLTRKRGARLITHVADHTELSGNRR